MQLLQKEQQKLRIMAFKKGCDSPIHRYLAANDFINRVGYWNIIEDIRCYEDEF